MDGCTSNDRTSSGATRQEMQKAAHAPEKILAAAEGLHFFRCEDAGFDGRRSDFLIEDVFRQPLQRMEIAQAAFAVLDVRFDLVSAFAGPACAFVAFRHFRVDELPRGSGDHFRAEAILEFGEELGVAEDQPGNRGGRCVW